MLTNMPTARSGPKLDKPFLDVLANESPEQQSTEGTSSTASFERSCADVSCDGLFSGSPGDALWDGFESATSSSVESSPLGCPRSPRHEGKLHSLPKCMEKRDAAAWEDRAARETDEHDVSEMEMMKERFAKLLLGEDLSGGGKGVSSALAISNAITNLAVSVFGQLYKLEPLPKEHKARWHKEMGWILSISDYIVDFVPSEQHSSDGTVTEVMISKPRQDLHEKLPALQKLDNMLLENLDSFEQKEFWYVGEKDGNQPFRQEEKWWIPTPRVSADGLTADARKHLEHQRTSISQILKAALAINAEVLSDMEVPAVYRDALPKNARVILGDALYRAILSESFSPDVLIASVDANHEHSIVEFVNRLEASLHVWKRKLQHRHTGSKSGWGLSHDTSAEQEKREVLSERAQSLLIMLRQKFPGLPQTHLDMNKIQFNKDVGHSILESYSRVLESLAFNVLSRINEVLHVDDVVKCNQSPMLSRSRSSSKHTLHQQRTPGKVFTHSSILAKSSSTHAMTIGRPYPESSQSKSLSDFIGWTGVSEAKVLEHCAQSSPWLPVNKQWVYSGSIKALRSPQSRD